MNKQKKNIIILLGILTLLILILFQNQSVKKDIITATSLWITQVFPSLFPMFILSDLLIYYRFPEYLANLLGIPFSKLFHTSSYGVFVFLMSILSGTPSSAFILKNLKEENKLTKEEASFLLSFTFFSNPLFLINMLSLIFPNNPKIIFFIIFSHYISNFLIGFILRPKNTLNFSRINHQETKKDFGTILSTSIKKTMDTLILILGTICFYYMIAHLISFKSPTINNFISGFFELTQGLNSLINYQVPINLKAIIAVSFISFGGLSIHTQIHSIIKDTGISYKPFLKGRILHVLLASLLTLACATIIT